MSMNNPLYITGLTPGGIPLIGGIFTLKDTFGFPLDMSYELVKENGHLIDYCELLCDAWLNDCLKFDMVVRELEMLGGSHVEEWKLAGAVWLQQHAEAMKMQNPVDEFCRFVLSEKQTERHGLIAAPKTT